MLYLNPLSRRVLITPPEVVAQAFSNDSVDQRRIKDAIEIAEERFAREALGWALYESLAAEKNRLITDDNNEALQELIDQTYPDGSVELKAGMWVNSPEFLSVASLALWNERLWKYVAECVHFSAIPDFFVDMTAQGIMKNNPPSTVIEGDAARSASASLQEAKWKMDKWLSDRITPLESALHKYLLHFVALFPTYHRAAEANVGACGAGDGRGLNGRNTGFILGVYDDEDGRRPGCATDWL